jgi:hypothetical protein
VTAVHESGKSPANAEQRREREMAEHKHGSMDIRAQEKTFAGFINMTKWGVIVIIGVLIFLALANA